MPDTSDLPRFNKNAWQSHGWSFESLNIPEFTEDQRFTLLDTAREDLYTTGKAFLAVSADPGPNPYTDSFCAALQSARAVHDWREHLNVSPATFDETEEWEALGRLIALAEEHIETTGSVH